MSEEDRGQQVTDQAVANTDTQASTAGAGTDDATAAVRENQGEQADAQSALTQDKQVDIGPKDLPKELEATKAELLKDYYAKTRELSEQRREIQSVQEKAKLLEELWGYQPFQDWYQKEQQHGKGAASNTQQAMTEDQMEELRSNPQKFQEYMESLAERTFEKKYGSAMNRTQEQLENIRMDRELEELARKYADFDTINNAGLLDNYVDKGRGFEEAYALYKLNNPGNIDASITKRAAELVNKSRLSSTEKPTGGTHPGSKIYKPRTLDEAMDMGFKAAEKGEKFRFQKPDRK